MFATALIVFREVFEVSLVVGIVMAAAKGAPHRNFWVGAGLGAGIAGAVLVAMFAAAISAAAEGLGQELFNATVLFLAVAMLAWHNIWMARHGRELAGHAGMAGHAVQVADRPPYALAVVTGVAVLREGSEIVLFLNGIAASQGMSGGGMLAGGIIGLALGAAVGVAIYLGLLRLSGRLLFAVTGWLIAFLAAGMAAKGAAFLIQAGYLPQMGHAVWDLSWLLSERSMLGNLLGVLIGYTARPDGAQLLFYAVTLGVISAFMLRSPAANPAQARH